MDPNRVNTSQLHSQSGPIGQMSLKSSPFCPRSSSRLTQYIIQDHMVSHYRKVYSAKAAIDASVPKSMLHSVKYNDQLQRDQLRRSQSQTQSQRSSRTGTRTSCVSENVRGRRSAQGEESGYFCLGSPSPRLNTSFHAKQVVYPSQAASGSASPPRLLRSASEFSYRNAGSQRQHSARSCPASASLGGYKAFRDPAQKTYSGDLLQTHARHFTQDTPFTPRTLRSDSGSYLAQYRYYTPPRRKAARDTSSPRLTRQETYHGCTRAKELSSDELHDPPQGLDGEQAWSDDEPHTLYNHTASGHQSKASRCRTSDLHLSSYRTSPEGMKSPIMNRVSDEEEELMYLEFIADVTNEILLRGRFSDRVLERVFERHVEINKLRLDEDKMRHLLEVLRKDLQSPASAPTVSAEPQPGVAAPPPRRRRQSPDTDVSFDTKEDRALFPYASFKDGGELEGAAPLSVSTPLRARSPAQAAEEELRSPDRDHAPPLGERTDPPLTNDEEELQPSPAEQRDDDDDDGASTQAEALCPALESLCMTSDPQGNTGASLSEDEF